MFDLSRYHIRDLTLPYSKEIEGYDSEISRTVEKDGWNARNLHIYSHAGTHMDAPLHFGIGETSIDQYPPSRLMGKAWVVNIPIHEPQQLLTIEDLGDLTDHFRRGESLLIRTEWSQFVGLKKYRSELPRISQELAEWCVNKGVNILGVEPPSVADVNNLEEVTTIHHILLGGQVIILEGLCNLHSIQRDNVFLIALPLSIKGGDGAPARVIALEEKVSTHE